MHSITFEHLDISALREKSRIDGESALPASTRLTCYAFEDVDLALISIVPPLGCEFAFFGGIEGKLNIALGEWGRWNNCRKDVKTYEALCADELKRKKIPARKRACLYVMPLPPRTLIRFMFPASAVEPLRQWIAKHLQSLGEKAFIAQPGWRYGLEALTYELLHGNFTTHEVLKMTNCPSLDLMVALTHPMPDITEEERVAACKKLLEESKGEEIHVPLTMAKVIFSIPSFGLSQSELLRAEAVSRTDCPSFFDSVILSISRYVGWEGAIGRSVKLKSPLFPPEIYETFSPEQLAMREPLLDLLNRYVSKMLSRYPALGDQGEWLLASIH